MIARKKLVTLGAALAVLGSTVGVGFVGDSPAHADPKQIKTNTNQPLVTFGSDTTSQILNALAGYAFGTFYTPMNVADTQIVSWNALSGTGQDNDCFIPSPGAPSIHRPNGSGEGRGMLHAATETGAKWGHAAAPVDPCGIKDVTGLIQFARSSSSSSYPLTGGANGASKYVYLPFARDALAWGYYKAGGGSTVTNLTVTELQTLWKEGPKMADPQTGLVLDGDTTDDVLVVPCDINTTSGTRGDWYSKLSLTAGEISSNVPAATEACRLAPTSTDNAIGQIEENAGNYLTDKGNALIGTSHEDCDGSSTSGTTPVPCTNAQVVIGFAASAFIAKGNLVPAAQGNGSALLGTIGGGDTPYTGSPGSYAAVENYYWNTQGGLAMGRNVSNMITVSAYSGGAPTSNVPLRAMFRNGTGAWNLVANGGDGDGVAEICEANKYPIIEQFGFLRLDGSRGAANTCGYDQIGFDPTNSSFNLAVTPAVDW